MKHLQNLGKILNKPEQKSIYGGDAGEPGCVKCKKNSDCGTGGICYGNNDYPGCHDMTCGCGNFCL